MPKGARNAEINRARAEAAREAQLHNYTVADTGCWLWSGGTTSDGYGKVKRDGRTRRAHHIFFEAEHGSIPEGKVVCHRCDTPLCVRPGHLFAGTPLENEQDKDRKGRRVTPYVRRHKLSPLGEAHHKARLTDEAVRAIRGSTATNRELADVYDVHITTIQRTRAGLFWKHL